MNSSKATKLLVLGAAVAIINIVVLSPGLLGIRIRDGSAFEAALGVTVLLTSLLALLYGSYQIFLASPPAAKPMKPPDSHADYVEGLERYRKLQPVKQQVQLGLNQLDRIVKKTQALSDVLQHRFDPGELSFRKFQGVIDEVEKLFYVNVRGILNKLHVFESSGFSAFANQARSGPFSDQLMQEKTRLYNEYMKHIQGYIAVNEEILLKLDKLLLEISLLGSADYRDVEEMPGMKEIDALIRQTKLYKQ